MSALSVSVVKPVDDLNLRAWPYLRYDAIYFSVRITWKPEYAGLPHLFSLPHGAHAGAKKVGTEGPTLIFLQA